MDVEAFRQNLGLVRERITAAALRSGRDPQTVRLMAVTKTFPAEYVETARQAGVTLFGENRVQEAQAKYPRLLEGDRQLELHLIGHLQRNKAKTAAQLFRCVQSIDKLETAEALDRHCRELGRGMEILLELNTSAEQSKFGFASAEQLWECCERITELPALSIRGVMTVGPFTSEQERIRAAFTSLRKCYQGLRSRFPRLPLDVLSMGMSGDFEIAIEEGATLIRVGTALFGRREG